MPTIAEASKPPANIGEMVALPAQVSVERRPAVPAISAPDYDPLSLAPPPTILSTVPDKQRQWYRQGVSQYRIPPLPTKADPSINASSASVAKIIVQQAIAKIPPVVVPPAVGDGLVHGDAIWETDSAYISWRDDFAFGSPSATTAIGELGWVRYNGNR